MEDLVKGSLCLWIVVQVEEVLVATLIFTVLNRDPAWPEGFFIDRDACRIRTWRWRCGEYRRRCGGLKEVLWSRRRCDGLKEVWWSRRRCGGLKEVWWCCRIKILHQQVLILGIKLVSLVSLVLGSIGVLPLTRTGRVSYTCRPSS